MNNSGTASEISCDFLVLLIIRSIFNFDHQPELDSLLLFEELLQLCFDTRREEFEVMKEVCTFLF